MAKQETAAVDGDLAAPVVSLKNLNKQFHRVSGEIARAIDNVSLDIYAGEFMVLLGPSGCGKTTLLRCVAGLEVPDSGVVSINGRECFDSDQRTSVRPEKRGLGMIFQSYALWPHMTVFDNVAYPIRSRGKKRSKAEIIEVVEKALSRVEVLNLAQQYPGQISGGQQQRVALARALVEDNSVVLFDEPLSNVDAKVREQLRAEMVEMQRDLGFAAIYVTHDQSEAMGLAHRIAVMAEGRVAQLGRPREIYQAAANRYVSNFVGTSNELEGTLREIGASHAAVDTSAGVLWGKLADPDVVVGEAVVVSWRPEDTVWHSEEPGIDNRLGGFVAKNTFLGPFAEAELRLGEAIVRVWTSPGRDAVVGGEAWVSVDRDSVRVFRSDPQAA